MKMSVIVLMTAILLFMGCFGGGSTTQSETVDSSQHKSSDVEMSSERADDVSSEVISIESSQLVIDSSDEDVLSSSSSSSSMSSTELSSSESVNSRSSSEDTNSDSSDAERSSSVVVTPVSSSEEVYLSQESITIDAEEYDSKNGSVTHEGDHIANIEQGDWIHYSEIDFGAGGFRSIIFSASLFLNYEEPEADESFFEIHIDSLGGEIIGIFEPDNTGDWGTFTEQSIPVSRVEGVHDLYFVAGDYGFSDGVGNLDAFTLQSESVDALQRVLFVGNSYTFYNNMPELVEAMIRSEGYEVIVERSTKPGAWWDFHDDTAEAVTLDLIEQGNYDAVIIQNNSKSSLDAERFLTHGAVLIDAIKESGARALLYETWGREAYNAADGIDQDTISAMYQALANQENISVVPVGTLWQEVRDADATLGNDLFSNDGSHPSPLGSYFIAMTFYRYLTKMSVADLPKALEGVSVDEQKLEALKTHVDALSGASILAH
ncbi:MAG: carbohydrate-binding protein [Fibrobacterales bacterium]